MTLGSGRGFGVNYECAPDESFPILPADGMIVHANHWSARSRCRSCRTSARATVPESVYRDWRVRRLLDAAGTKLTTDHLKAGPVRRFRHALLGLPATPPEHHNNLSATVAMVIMQPAEGIMEVAPLPALQRHFTRYDLRGRTLALAAAE